MINVRRCNLQVPGMQKFSSKMKKVTKGCSDTGKSGEKEGKKDPNTGFGNDCTSIDQASQSGQGQQGSGTPVAPLPLDDNPTLAHGKKTRWAS